MYTIRRVLWFSIYAVAFVVMVALSMTYGTGWAWGTWATLFGAFVVLTSPSPRMRPDELIECDCPKCTGPCGYAED